MGMELTPGTDAALAEQQSFTKEEFDLDTTKRALAINWPGIPEELKAQPQWCFWIYLLRPDKKGKPKRTKVPFSLRFRCRPAYAASSSSKKPPLSVRPTPRKAKSNDPTTWETFEAAAADFEICQHFGPIGDGIGYYTSVTDPFTVIDLDSVRDPITGELNDLGASIVSRFPSYTEVSPSGTGVKIFIRGKKPGRRCKTARFKDVELYDQLRFVAITGATLPGTPSTINDCSAELTAFYNELFPNDAAEREQAARVAASVAAAGATDHRPLYLPLPLNDASDQEIIDRALSSRGGSKFAALWSGDDSGYPSRSEADSALAGYLAFYCGNDPGRIISLMFQSGLRRDKWNRPAYLSRTVSHVLSRATSFYSQRSSWGNDTIDGIDVSGVEARLVLGGRRPQQQPLSSPSSTTTTSAVSTVSSITAAASNVANEYTINALIQLQNEADATALALRASFPPLVTHPMPRKKRSPCRRVHKHFANNEDPCSRVHMKLPCKKTDCPDCCKTNKENKIARFRYWIEYEARRDQSLFIGKVGWADYDSIAHKIHNDLGPNKSERGHYGRVAVDFGRRLLLVSTRWFPNCTQVTSTQAVADISTSVDALPLGFGKGKVTYCQAWHDLPDSDDEQRVDCWTELPPPNSDLTIQLAAQILDDFHLNYRLSGGGSGRGARRLYYRIPSWWNEKTRAKLEWCWQQAARPGDGWRTADSDDDVMALDECDLKVNVVYGDGSGGTAYGDQGQRGPPGHETESLLEIELPG